MLTLDLNMLRTLWTKVPQVTLGNPKPNDGQLLYLAAATLHVWTAGCHAMGCHMAAILGCTELAIAIVYMLLSRHNSM